MTVKSPASRSLYTYYLKQSLLPTYGSFSKSTDLERHDAARRAFFTEKLHLPPRLFRGAQVAEFGPDSGENSLAFARWGASMTLVEPNPRSWPRIRDYFRIFRLEPNLRSLVRADIESFSSRRTFDIVDAEGFIYTVRPESLWINCFHRILNQDGLSIISYYEAAGALMELLLKAILSRVKETSGQTSRDAARELFEPKWDSIPHIRSFDSWVMDVLDNPFVRLRYFFRAGELCTKMFRAGFDLYSSWPQYADALGVYCHKVRLPEQTLLAHHLDFISRSSLSFLFARRLFLPSSAAVVASVAVSSAISAIDGLIDRPSSPLLRRAIGALDTIEKVLRTWHPSEKDPRSVVRCIRQILARFAQPEALVRFCRTDETFIRSWGMPTHFAVFRKR